MFKKYVLQFILTLSLPGALYTSSVPGETTREPQMIQACIDEKWTECKIELAKRLSKDSTEYKQLTHLYDFPYEAAQLGYTQLIQVLLNSGVGVNNKYGKYNRTLLHDAAGWGQNDLVTFLLRYGAVVNVKDNLGNTPLHHAVVYAIYFNSTKIVEQLVKHGADIDSGNNLGLSPVCLAISYNASSVNNLLNSGSSETKC